MGTPNDSRLPEEIYVRRRIAAVVAILVVVALVIWGLVALAGGGEDEETDPATQTTTQAADTETAPETESSDPAETTETTETSETTESESESENPTESTAAAGTEGAKQSCALADLQVSVTSDQPNYGATTEPTFYMTVENPTAVDCDIDLSRNVMRFEVYNLATNQRVWSDVDCNAPVGDGGETFEAGSERNFQAVWSRTSSSPDSCGDRQPVPSGAYFLHGVIGDNASNSYTFNLG